MLVIRYQGTAIQIYENEWFCKLLLHVTIFPKLFAKVILMFAELSKTHAAFFLREELAIALVAHKTLTSETMISMFIYREIP